MRFGPRPLTISSGRRAIVWTAVVCALLCGHLIAQAPQARFARYDPGDVEAGSHVYASQCAPCHGTNGDMIEGVDFRHGQFKTIKTDDDFAHLLATGRPAAGMPSFATFAAADVNTVIAYVRAGFDPDSNVGNASQVRSIFSGKGGCSMCHRVDGRGPRLASDLSDIGSIRTATSLRRAIVDPSGSLPPAGRTIRAVTKGGQTLRGRRLNEDTYTVQLIDDQERIVSLNKADLRSYEVSKQTDMPSYATTLTPDDVSDLVAYLTSLKGVHP